MQEIYEKLGLFYLGKDVDRKTMEPLEALTLLKNKSLTTHAAIIGMTGSGKTGLGVGIIEEAAIDNIPSIVIDPKGDMGDLCLTDPSFSADAFKLWVRDEALSKDEDPETYASKTAKIWKAGIESFGQDTARVEKFHSIKKTIYTPGSSAGVSINIMSSLERPPTEVIEDSDTFNAYLKSTTTSLLSLVGIHSDPLDSKAYILLAQIIARAWLAKEDLSIEVMIGKIIKPSFDKIGVLPLNDFYSRDDRFKLATRFNSLLASPSFSLWLQGENLDIQKLLYDENGKANIAIFSIAHLGDDERMFFVTLLLNKYIAWMRRQSGTSALKTILYMDEIFGYFPPTKNPPSKAPMMILLKQARAFGIGIVLSTQNPVDLDYKGLSNIGTWFIGRLQTKQDIERVISGLGGKIGSSFEKNEIKTLLANLKKRTFFLKSAHLDDIRLFTTRWVLSYLKGPLKKDEIASLMASQKSEKGLTKKSMETFVRKPETFGTFQNVDLSIPQYYEPDPKEENTFFPTLGAKATVHFYNQRKGIDTKKNIFLSMELNENMQQISWEDALDEAFDFTNFPHTAPKHAQYYDLPEVILQDRGLKHAVRELKDLLYQREGIELFRCRSPKLESKLGESRSDFIVQVQDILQENKENAIEKLKTRYASKEKILHDRLLRAQERVKKESSDSTASMIEMGISVLGALFGKASPTKIGRTISKGGRILKEHGDMSRAEERVSKIEDDIDLLNDELEGKIDALHDKYSIEKCEIEIYKIKPRRNDIDVETCAIVWKTS